ncbi:hypothetical protein SESBI_36323 [Sesbania bispinosa]|nr:hypothetical protein SESBI_36323 [Sesbania bispinosa]
MDLTDEAPTKLVLSKAKTRAKSPFSTIRDVIFARQACHDHHLRRRNDLNRHCNHCIVTLLFPLRAIFLRPLPPPVSSSIIPTPKRHTSPKILRIASVTCKANKEIKDGEEKSG